MTNQENPTLAGGGSSKIRTEHWQRLAIVYVRQSSPQQVLRNRESQFNQYRLVERAQALGWVPERIRVIDTDQALSARDSQHRDGFQELVSEVSLGHVGILFGYEVSRLARNNSDWYHLLDLAAVFGTLIADDDGIYDPRLYNDRLLLGLKGTLSEAELHWLQQRLAAGRMSQVRRGVYRQRLPTGLLRQPDGAVVQDPDDQVRQVITLVLEQFARLGSCAQVLRYLRHQNLRLPRRPSAGLHRGELVWKAPTDAAIYEMVRNPAYAGAFVYGRKQTDPTRRQPGRAPAGVAQPMDKWIHIQQNVYPAYISWEQYLANQERLHQNGMSYSRGAARAQGAAREGAALLQGLVTCGVCGGAMCVRYKPNHRYSCQARSKRAGEPECLSVQGPSLDEVVVQAFFEALRPAQLDALEAVLQDQQAEHQRLRQQWEAQVQRARYETHLAERQYAAVDPENRLVAAELERRWEERLRQEQATQEAYERFLQTPAPGGLTSEQQEQFRRISETLPEVWPALAVPHQKELLRSLISRVILNRVAPDQVEARIVWISGHYSVTVARPPLHRQQDGGDYPAMVERIHTLWEEGWTDAAIAERLRAEGFRSARAQAISRPVVIKIRQAQGWYRSERRKS